MNAASATQSLPLLQAFFFGVLGALLGYFILYRETRIADFVKAPAQHWKTLVSDLVIYLVCGGLVTTFLVVPSSPKEAFTGGLAWQALAGGFIAGAELDKYRKYEERREIRDQGTAPVEPGRIPKHGVKK
jgi:membrane associated rhomboid family serine protease